MTSPTRSTIRGFRSGALALALGLGLAGGAAAQDCSDVVTVDPGDTLAGIAARYGVALKTILEVNPEIDDPRIILVGQRIVVPGDRRAEGPDRERGERRPGAERPGDRRDEIVRIRPRRGPVGADVRIRATGYPAHRPVEVGFGPPRSEYEVIRSARTDARGRLDVTVDVPRWAEPGRDYVFVVATRDHDDEAVSVPFAPSAEGDRPERAEDGVVVVRGTLTDEGVECQALRSSGGTLYTLAGDMKGFENGDRVAVKGRPADLSYCMQGTTLEVVEIQPAHRGQGRGDRDRRRASDEAGQKDVDPSPWYR